MEPSDAAEQIIETKETGDDKFKARAALIIGFMAMLLAITSLGGGNVLEDMIAHNIHASDTWAFYQAKTIRQTAVRNSAAQLEAELKMNPNMPADARQFIESRIDDYRKTAERYDDEPDKSDPTNPLKGEGRKQLTARARDFEAQREIAQKKDPNFDFAEALFQIAIVLASVSILATARRILQLAVIAGFAATLLMINGYFLILPNLL
jgi:hypothetical protein